MRPRWRTRHVSSMIVALMLFVTAGCASKNSPENASPSVESDSSSTLERLSQSAVEVLDEIHSAAQDRVDPLIVDLDDPDSSNETSTQSAIPAGEQPTETGRNEGLLSARLRVERNTAFNPYLLTAHRQNYFIPLSVTSAFNDSVYEFVEALPLAEELQHQEVKFQISLKTRINEDDILFHGDAFNFGLTIKSWWQLYSTDISSPFRETNYQPEFFYSAPLLRAPVEGLMSMELGFVHESNGQVQGLSRSWNRIYATLYYLKDDFHVSLKPWIRIPEQEKENPTDAEGDDNPDILDYMGHGELEFGWRSPKYDVLASLRGNTSTGKGALQLEATYPLFSRYRGFVQFFSGYGDSLIDHDLYQTRLGVGVALSTLF